MPTTSDHRDATVLRPTGLADLHAAIADTAASHPRLLIAGQGTAADWGGPPAPPDAVLDTTGLSGILACNPADLTIAVRAGTPLTAIRDELSPRRQRVSLDAARIDRGATVGGLLATADAGPARHCFGSLRDLVIGVTVLLGDGTIAHSGGHVIKNVAGYDLAKLWHGSLGTLGVVAEVVLRLHPIPPATATVRIPCGATEAVELAGRIIGAGLEPTALEWTDADAGRLLVRLEGTPDGVRDRVAGLSTVAGPAAETLDEAGADECWRTVAAISDGASGDTVLRVGTLPSAGPAVLGRITDLAAAQGISADVDSSIAVGVHTIRLRGTASGDPGAHAAVLDALYAEGGATVSVQRRDGLAPDHPGWGPPPPTVPVLRAIKRRFDPDGRFGAGRFAHWLDDPEEDGRP